MEENQKAEIEAGTLYDVNKELVNQEKEMSPSAIREMMPKLTAWFYDKRGKYAMLLNNENRYYTVFRVTDKHEFAARECIECLKDCGGLVSGYLQPDGAWEFWLHEADGGSKAYYLFDYTAAVIEC